MDTSIKNGIEIKIAFVQKTEKYFINNKELEKKFYEFEKDIVNPGKYYNLGYKNTQALVSNFRNTPNNTLSLFWHENDQWKPLFKRKAKNDFSNKWKEKVHIIRWFLAYKKVPGIIVNEKISVPKTLIREVRKQIYFVNKFGLEEHLIRNNYSLDYEQQFIMSIYGKISFIKMIDFKKGVSLQKKFNEVLGNIESSNMYRDNIDFDDIELHWIN